MASYTTNLNLTKPSGSENVNIGIINGNMDTIDAAVGSLNSKISKFYSTGVSTSADGVKTFSARGNTNFLLIFYADHMTMIFVGGQSTQIFRSGDNPADYGFTLVRDNLNFTLTRDSGSNFQFAMLEID